MYTSFDETNIMYELPMTCKEDSRNTQEEIVVSQKEYEKILNYYDGLNTTTKVMR